MKKLFNKLIKMSARKKRILIILLFPVLAAAITVAILLFTSNEISEYTFDEQGAQYYLNNRYVVNEGSKLKKNEQSEVKLIYEDVDNSISNIPVYLDSCEDIILTRDMIYVNINNFDGYTYLPVFTRISNLNGNITISYGKESKSLNDGLLYDGNDMYIFLEPVTLNFNGSSVELGTLSYCEATFRGSVNSYDTTTKQCYSDTIQSDIVAEKGEGDFSVSLLNDSYINYKGEKFLLFTDVRELHSIFD